MRADSLGGVWMAIGALAGVLLLAGCAANSPSSTGNPTQMGATPSPAADQKTDSMVGGSPASNTGTSASGSADVSSGGSGGK
jgi:uncharacterized lipoprotein YajG